MHAYNLFVYKKEMFFVWFQFLYIHSHLHLHLHYIHVTWLIFMCQVYIYLSVCCVVRARVTMCVCVFATQYNSLSNGVKTVLLGSTLLTNTLTPTSQQKNLSWYLFFICFFFPFNIVKCKRIWHHVEVNLKVANFFFGRNTMDAYSSIHRRKKLNPLLIIYMWMNFKNHMTQIYLINLKPITILTTFDRDWWLLFLDFFVNFRTF